MIIEPSLVTSKKKVPTNKQTLVSNLSSKMDELIMTDDGKTLTVAQAIAERLSNIAMFAESNTDAIAASKLIFERLYGKAAIEKKEDTKPMPKVVFALNDVGLDRVASSVNQELPQDPSTDNAGILVEFDDGKEMII